MVLSSIPNTKAMTRSASLTYAEVLFYQRLTLTYHGAMMNAIPAGGEECCSWVGRSFIESGAVQQCVCPNTP
jgi:hypothetical protein